MKRQSSPSAPARVLSIGAETMAEHPQPRPSPSRLSGLPNISLILNSLLPPRATPMIRNARILSGALHFCYLSANFTLCHSRHVRWSGNGAPGFSRQSHPEIGTRVFYSAPLDVNSISPTDQLGNSETGPPRPGQRFCAKSENWRVNSTA